MNEPGTLILLCGKMAAGKSTLAARLADERGAILFGEDALLAALYPDEVHDLDGYLVRSRQLKRALRAHIVDLLRRGMCVVMDFPANTVRQRQWLRGLFDEAGASHELHYLEASDASCKERLARRAVAQPERSATDTPEMFDLVTAHFRPPSPDEGFDVIHHDV
jgi:predicted kinase